MTDQFVDANKMVPESSMTDLSPAAQAALDAAHEVWITKDDPRSIAAAALRAAADHVPDHQMSAHMLYAIAAELENE